MADLMTTEVITIPPEMELFAIAHEFVTRRVRRLPVIDRGRLIGQVSRRDALRVAHELRLKSLKRKRYPDYPAGREPITNYPR